MEKGAVVVCVIAALIGLAVVGLGIAAERSKNEVIVRTSYSYCEYRRTPALRYGIAAAGLSLTAVVYVTRASGCFGCCGDAALPPGRRRGCARNACAAFSWLCVVLAAGSFLYGGAQDAVCEELRDGVFVSASIEAVIAIAFAITAYVDALQQSDSTPTLGVAMGQPNAGAA